LDFETSDGLFVGWVSESVTHADVDFSSFRPTYNYLQFNGFPRKAKKFNGKVRREAPHFTALS